MVIQGQVNMRKTCRKSDSESVKRSSGERDQAQEQDRLKPSSACLETV
jgi:hypothetical protein